MIDGIRIRVATVADAERISTLLAGLAEEFIVGDFSAAGRQHLTNEFGVEAVASRLASADYRFHLAETAAGLAGVVAMRGDQHLYLLFVERSWHRKGLARRLWDVARDGAPAGVARFTVNASAYAVPAYERLGFRQVGAPQERSGVRFQPMEWVAAALAPPS